VELDKPEYSGGVRQELHRLAGQMQQEDIQIHSGGVQDYWERMMHSRWARPMQDPPLPFISCYSNRACATAIECYSADWGLLTPMP
jgi:hypothetical protein